MLLCEVFCIYTYILSRYEDMKANAAYEMKRILDFVNFTVTTSEIQARLEQDFTSFKRYKSARNSKVKPQ